MIKARGNIGGREVVFIGLSFANLDRLRAHPLDDHIVLKGEDLGVSFDLIITAGETEAAITELIEPLITPNTKVTVSPRLKS